MSRRALAVAAFAAGLVLPASEAGAAVSATQHNLAVGGPGTVKAATETQICVFCHAPHNASPSGPLWNRRSPGLTFSPYTSSTLKSAPGQPTGASLMCLSCHDGTIALGDVLTRATPITMSGGVTTLPAGANLMGKDLSDDHPVSFVYSAALATARGELVNPSTLTARVRLDASGQLQCTACHDPHDNANGKFLVMSNQAGALCQTCHVKNYWSTSDHRNSNATWSGVAPNPWPHTSWTTVSANACESCHKPHTAGGKLRLLNALAEENNCYPCHNGNVAPKNIQTEFSKASIHTVAGTTGVHDTGEPAVIQSRHVECVDCHNPHAATAGAGTPSGPLAGLRGITIAGSETSPAAYEYQICFRCHADSTGKPAPLVTRQIAQTNTRLEFSTSNPSHHAVAGPGVNTTVPSLIAPLTTASTIKCTSCHNNNAGPGAGGTGPNGPHGSTYRPLLERQYLTADNTAESAANYALCYKCHNQTIILGNTSFTAHNVHVSGAAIPCSACHDPHGISSTQGNSINNSRLINFDTSIAKPNSKGLLRYEWQGTFKGQCYTLCHGKDHLPCTYNGTAINCL